MAGKLSRGNDGDGQRKADSNPSYMNVCFQIGWKTREHAWVQLKPS